MGDHLTPPDRRLEHYRSLIMDSARWSGFEFRPGDIVISTAPKAGTTWMQTICSLLILQNPTPPPPDEVSPWMDTVLRPIDEVFALLTAQTHRRFIKTHTPLDGLPWDERVTYLCVGRDPRDMALSWDNHMFNTDFDAFGAARARATGVDDLPELMAQWPPPSPSAMKRFWEYMDGSYEPGVMEVNLAFAVHHNSTFWAVRDRPNVVLAHYGDLSANLAGQMRRLAGLLGIEVPDGSWPDLVAGATFKQMKARAATHTPESSHALWVDNARFFNRGICGQWKALLDRAGQARYAARVAELADPDLVTWLHGGSPR